MECGICFYFHFFPESKKVVPFHYFICYWISKTLPIFFFSNRWVFFTLVYKSSHFHFIDYFGTLHFSIRRRKRKMSTSFAQRSGVIKSAKKLRFCPWNFPLLCLLQKQSKVDVNEWQLSSSDGAVRFSHWKIFRIVFMLLWIFSDLIRQNLFQIFSHKLV